MPSERIEVYFEHGPVIVQEFVETAPITLENGVTVEERFFGRRDESANFRVTASKVVSSLIEVGPVHHTLWVLLEQLRLLWPIVGGARVDTPLVSNHEEVHRRLLAADGLHTVSRDFTVPYEAGCTYKKMPLKSALAVLRRLAKLPGQQDGGETEQVLWLCVEWYEMASNARQPLDKFMKAFPPLDLLASTYYQASEPKC